MKVKTKHVLNIQAESDEQVKLSEEEMEAAVDEFMALTFMPPWTPFQQQEDKDIYHADTEQLAVLHPRVRNSRYEVLFTTCDSVGNRVSELSANFISKQYWKANQAEAKRDGWYEDPRWTYRDKDSLIVVMNSTYQPPFERDAISCCGKDSAVANLDSISKKRLGKGEILWLSIKRHDRHVINDWREKQRIKNEICGPEMEAIELFPAMNRIVDTANQFHLWVKDEWKVGWNDGASVVDSPVASKNGNLQRPLPEWLHAEGKMEDHLVGRSKVDADQKARREKKEQTWKTRNASKNRYRSKKRKGGF